jgi:S-DNA-T family DNA segregation ATPase FtsK/SpoIIIE
MLEQPHLLIAGTTGSGKSVVVNALIYTALYNPPLDIAGGTQFILIDPKRVELVKYQNLPHTIMYASEPQDMTRALQHGLDTIEERYRKAAKSAENGHSGGDIYIIIDEFADLMTTNKKAVAPLVQRIAQIGRAAKVHLILCTQCPLSEIIPTKIKVNFDARLGLRTRSRQDSRNILERTGCELLPYPPRAHMAQGYYMTPEGTDLYTLKMYTQEQISERVQFWENQNKSGRKTTQTHKTHWI